MKPVFTKKWCFVISLIFFTPSLVYAHTGIGHSSGFLHGISHPLGGLDHILAMVAVGIWAAQISGKAVWAIPATFVGVMLMGGVLGITGITLPFVEQGIIMSILILGVLIAAAVRLPLYSSAAIVALFALFHGHTHGAEAPVAASGVAYGIGFALSTTILHLSGIGFGLIFQRSARLQAVQFSGAAIAVGGVFLILV